MIQRHSTSTLFPYTTLFRSFPAIAPTTATVACLDDIVMPTLPVVTDNCGNTLAPVPGTQPTPPACEGNMVYTWTYTDCEGNSQVYSHTVTIEYEPFPAIAPTTATEERLVGKVFTTLSSPYHYRRNT